MIDKKTVQSHFNKSSVTYNNFAMVQRKMAATLIAMLSKHNFNQPPVILEIGCGTGLFTQQLLKYFPNARITALDFAPGMIAEATKNINHPNVSFLCEDIEAVSLNNHYDLIVSNAVFQWFSNPRATLKKCLDLLTESGVFSFSTFGDQTFTELHQSFLAAKTTLGLNTTSMPGQTMLNLVQLKSLCQTCLNDPNYIIEAKENLEYEYFDTVSDFLYSIKKTGANNSNSQRNTNPSLTKAMLKNYQQNFNSQNGIQATYHCLYCSLSKCKGGTP